MPAGRARAHDEPTATNDQREATIVLHVVNFAALSHEVLNPARDRVAKVYEGIGVAERKISAEGVSEGALGQAHRANGRAYIFCERVGTMLGTKLFAIVLGAVIAHEVGHLVLPERSHSRSGIMRAEMDAQHAIHLQSFDKTQADMILTTLMTPTAGAAGR